MGRNEGQIIRSSRVVIGNAPGRKLNVVFLSEGYRAEELDKFAADTQTFINLFTTNEPFQSLREHFDFHRIDVASNESGIDDPGLLPVGASDNRATFFEGTYRYLDGPKYFIGVNNRQLVDEVIAENNIPQPVAPFVIVNSSLPGGSGGGVTVFTNGERPDDSGFAVGLHEYAHSFGIGDEYGDRPGPYPDTDAESANLAVTVEEARRKWGDLIRPGTPLPTVTYSPTPPVVSPFIEGTVGMFEGGRDFREGIYHPEFNCRMRSRLYHRFCAVCERTIRRKILDILQEN